MKSSATISEVVAEKDYYPSLFVNNNKKIVILADGRTGDKTFSGMVIHSDDSAKRYAVGTYSSAWTFEQFKRLQRGSEVTITIKQETL